MRSLQCLVLVGFTVFASCDASAAPLFGSVYGASAWACAAEAVNCAFDSTNASGDTLVVSSSGPQTAALADVRGSVGGLGDLHVYSSVSVFSSSGPINTNAFGGADAFFYDTFYFEAGSYRLDLVFDGGKGLSPVDNPDWITVTSDVSRFQLVADCTSIVYGQQYCSSPLATLSIGQSMSYLLNFAEPTTATLGGLAQVRAGLKINNAVPVGATFAIDASNTAFFNIVGLTLGAAYETASGVSYTADRFQRVVPEPPLLVYGFAALAGFGARWRRRAHSDWSLRK